MVSGLFGQPLLCYCANLNRAISLPKKYPMLDSKQTTVGFKVSALKKREIEQVAADLGIDVSTYLRDQILYQHERVKRLSRVPDELVFEESEIEYSLKAIRYFSELYPQYTTSQEVESSFKYSHKKSITYSFK